MTGQVWPYLLEYVHWGEDIGSKRKQTGQIYESLLTDWMAVEAIVRQKDKDAFEAGT